MDYKNNTPLHYAVQHYTTEKMVEYLILKGAKIETIIMPI